MRIVFAGSPSFAVPSLERLLASQHDIVGVVTQPDRPAGRGLSLRPSAVKEAASAGGLKVFTPEKFSTRSFRETLKSLEPDLIVVVAYGKIFRQKSLELPRLGCVNLHASLLPRYRGIAPVNRAIIEGELETGVTTIFMDRGIDTGDMILSEATTIADDETAGELLERLSVLGAGVLAETCDLVAGGQAGRTKQDDSQASYAPKLSREDGWISWSRTAREVHNRIRGVTPWPGAVATLGEHSVKIKASGLEDEERSEEPGRVIDIDSAKGILVSCSCGSVRLKVLQAEGRKAIAAADFARGYRLKVGDFFGSKTGQDAQG
jgi:methionyl-tRNA formyltransferase